MVLRGLQLPGPNSEFRESADHLFQANLFGGINRLIKAAVMRNHDAHDHFRPPEIFHIAPPGQCLQKRRGRRGGPVHENAHAALDELQSFIRSPCPARQSLLMFTAFIQRTYLELERAEGQINVAEKQNDRNDQAGHAEDE